MRAWIFALILLGAAAPLAGPTGAQSSAANTLREWGLMGTWSDRCDRPASKEYLRYVFTAEADGQAYLLRDFGNSDENDRNPILAAERRPDGTLALTIRFTTFQRVRLNVYARSGSRVRVVYNRGDDGHVSVENGILRHNSRPTPWMNKCG